MSPDNKSITTLYLPSDQEIRDITELQGRGLVSLRGNLGEGEETIKDGGLASFVQRLRSRYPGSSTGTSPDDRIAWALKPPASKDNFFYLSWILTDSGKQAVDLILRTVSDELVKGGEGT